MTTPIAGAQARICFGWETAYGIVSASLNKAFSQGVKISAYDIDNSVEYLYGLGSQDVTASVCKEFKGTFGLEFTLSDPWWLKSVLGGNPVLTGAGPYTYTYSNASGISNTLTSFSIDLSMDLDTDSNQQLLGCIANTASITCNVGEIVRVRLDGLFANLTKDTSMTSLVSPVEEPFSFAAGSLEVPTSTTIANVQNVELTFNRNVDLIWGLGSRFAQKNVAKQREWGIRCTATYEADSQFLDTLLGSTTAPTATPAEAATAQVTITNGGAGTAERSYTFNFTGVRIEKSSIPVSVEDVIKQDITMRARSLSSVIVVNNTSAAL